MMVGNLIFHMLLALLLDLIIVQVVGRFGLVSGHVEASLMFVVMFLGWAWFFQHPRFNRQTLRQRSYMDDLIK